MNLRQDYMCVLVALCQMGVVDQVTHTLLRPHQAYHEHLMRALLALITRCPAAAIAECRRPELTLRDLLEQRMRELEGREEFKVKVSIRHSTTEIGLKSYLAEI